MIATELWSPKLNCATCAPAHQLSLGCEKDARIGNRLNLWWKDFDGQLKARCPRRPIFENPVWFERIILAYNAYKAGFLPHEGGMGAQPAMFAHVIGIIDSTIAWCAEEKRKKPE